MLHKYKLTLIKLKNDITLLSTKDKMGKAIAIITWVKTSTDISHLNYLETLRVNYKLTKDNEADEVGMQKYGVLISGIEYWWLGETYATYILQSFLYEAIKYFTSMNLNVEIETTYS